MLLRPRTADAHAESLGSEKQNVTYTYKHQAVGVRENEAAPNFETNKHNMTDDQNIEQELQDELECKPKEVRDKDQRLMMQLSTRVKPEIGAQMLSICNQFGFSVFFCLQKLVEVMVRMKDDQHNLTPELMRIIRQFENIPGWSKSICLADSGQEFGIVEAIYIMRAPGREGYRLCWVERPMMDGDAYGWSATYNVQYILERFIEVMNPSLYKHLRLLAVDLGTESMLDTIQRIADEYMENPDEIELRMQFENNDWHKGAKMYEEHNRKRPTKTKQTTTTTKIQSLRPY